MTTDSRPLTAEEIEAIRDRMDVWSDYGPDPTDTILRLLATLEAANPAPAGRRIAVCPHCGEELSVETGDFGGAYRILSRHARPHEAANPDPAGLDEIETTCTCGGWQFDMARAANPAPAGREIRFSGTVTAWPDEGRQITIEVGPDCNEYPSIGESVVVTRHANPAPAGLTDEGVARLFHETYERLAPSFGYETRKASAVPWEDVPQQNKALMIAVAGEVRAALAVGDA